MIYNTIDWEDTKTLDESKRFVCGYCGSDVTSNIGYRGVFTFPPAMGRMLGEVEVNIFVCHACTMPTYFDQNNNQVPGKPYLNQFFHIESEDVKMLLHEINACYAGGAYTATVMACRKALMNISVAEGADEGKTYVYYVDYLDENGHVHKNLKPNVHKIRDLGNGANHKVVKRTQEEAELIMGFLNAIVMALYELPGQLERFNKSK